MDIERSIEIAAAPADVWSVMVAVERWPEWTASITAVERLDAGPLAVGSRVRVRQPRLPVAVWTVTVLEPGRFFEWRNTSPGLLSVGGHRVEPTDDGHARVTLSIEWSGWLAPLIRLLYLRLSRGYVDLEAEGLKRRCESPAG